MVGAITNETFSLFLSLNFSWLILENIEIIFLKKIDMLCSGAFYKLVLILYM